MDGGEELPAALVSATGNAVALLSVEVSVEGTLTGEGPAEVLKGTQVVVDVPNSPSFADDAVMKFFRTSTANLLKAEAEAGVNHHVALSVVGTERLQESGYFRAKQEIIRRSLVAKNDPCTVVTDPHATYFGTELEETTPSRPRRGDGWFGGALRNDRSGHRSNRAMREPGTGRETQPKAHAGPRWALGRGGGPLHNILLHKCYFECMNDPSRTCTSWRAAARGVAGRVDAPSFRCRYRPCAAHRLPHHMVTVVHDTPATRPRTGGQCPGPGQERRHVATSL